MASKINLELESFSEEQFDLKGWTNRILERKPKEESVEQYLATVVLKLQVLSSEVSNSLEEASLNALSSVPRSIREIENIRNESTILKKKIDTFHENLSNMEGSTVASLKFLSELDKIKIKIEGVNNALKEAEKLSKRTENMEVLFTQQDFQKLANEICEMQHSLKVLHDIPEFTSKEKELEKLQERLDIMIKPQLMQALEKHKIEESIEFVKIYSKINRMEQLLTSYYACRKAPIEQYWNAFEKQVPPSSVNSPQIHSPNATYSFVQWLPSFYDQLLTCANEELNWVKKVFPKEYSVVPILISEILSTIGPHFKKRIDKYIIIESNPSKSLDDLISLFLITQNFSKTISSAISTNVTSKEKMIYSIFEPYFPSQANYPKLERKKLQNELSQMKPNLTDFMETISQVDNSVSRLFLNLEKSIDRCLKFTLGSEGEGLVETINDICSDYIQYILTVVGYLRQKAQLDISTEPGNEKKSSVFEWTFFQGSLLLLQIVNKFSSQLSSFERNLKNQLFSQKANLLGKTPNLKTNPEKTKKISTFYRNLEDVEYKLLGPPFHLLENCKSSVHTLAFDCVFFFIKDRLFKLPSLPEWSAIPKQSTMQLPEFSLSPLSYINQIGEHLLTLPQQLESVSLEDSSLYFDPKANQNLGKEFNLSTETDFVESSELEKTDGTLSLKSPTPQEEEEESKFATQWIAAVAQATMSLYFQKITEIPSLSEKGTKQLTKDIEYLINVLNALGMTIDSNLKKVHQYVKLTKEELNQINLLEDENEQQIIRMIASKRGLL